MEYNQQAIREEILHLHTEVKSEMNNQMKQMVTMVAEMHNKPTVTTDDPDQDFHM